VPDDQHASVDVPLDELTDRVIELYWPQTRPLAWNEGRPLRQASEASEILSAISEFRKESNAGPNKLLADAKREAPEGAYVNAFKKVKRTLVRYPLRLLQNVPGDSDAFLYDDSWIQAYATSVLATMRKGITKLEQAAGSRWPSRPRCSPISTARRVFRFRYCSSLLKNCSRAVLSTSQCLARGRGHRPLPRDGYR
jgi:hypothetical protein